MRLFGELELSSFIVNKRENIINSILSNDDDYLLNVNDEDFIAYQLSQSKIEPLNLFFDEITTSEEEKMIPAEWFPRNFNVSSGKRYKKPVYKFHIPFRGNSELLRCTPSTRIMWSMNAEVINDELNFEIINFSDDTNSIKRELDQNISNIRKQLEYLQKDITKFNNSLEQLITQTFQKRKEAILKSKNTLSSLGIPIRSKVESTSTFSVPSPKVGKKISISKPIVTDTVYKPEPTLDDKTYNEILQLIDVTCKQFERTPSVYIGKEEEHLRDHILLSLEPSFEGSATGETFNKTGKTDILLRYEGENVFIGECKFWHGKKGLLDTITQLLGYLTWRDSKSAVIMFVQNKDFSSVLETVKTETNSHPNFIKYVNDSGETCFNYEFHINDDRNRKVKLAVMLYHLPNPK